MKGGYQILDLKGNNFTINGTAVVVSGIYEAIEGSYGKPLMIENYSISGIEKNGRWLNLGIDNGNYVSEVGLNADLTKALYIKVTVDDAVSFYDL